MKKFTILMIALLVAAMGFAQTKQLTKPTFKASQNSVAFKSTRAVTGTLKHCGDYVEGNGIGTGSAGTLYAASRFETADLTSYVGQYITKITIGIDNASVITSGKVGILTGTIDAPVVAYEQACTFVNGVNEIELIVPYQIPTETAIMVAYEVTVTGGYPLGMDAGPAVTNGDLLCIGAFGDELVSMTEYDLSYNNIIAATVEDEISTDPVMMVSPSEMSFVGFVGDANTTSKTATIVAANLTDDITITTAAPFEVSADNTTFGTSATMTGAGTFYVRYIPADAEALNVTGTVTVATAGVDNQTIALTAITYDCTAAITSFPYEEGFENGIPQCWTLVDGDEDGNNWFVSTTGGVVGYGGQGFCATSASYYGTALHPDNWLITPPITLPTTTNIINLRFYANGQDASYAAEHYGVYISTTTNDTAAFTMLWEETMNSNGGNHRVQGTWGEKNTDLSAYAGQTVYIAIRHFNVSDQFYLNIDNFSIFEILAQDIAVTNVNFGTASNCTLETNTVIVTVKNVGTEPISSFGLSYAVNEGTPVEVTVTPAQAIASDSVYTYTFEQAITIDADGDYDVEVIATLEGDTNTDDNEAEGSFSRFAPETLPYTLVINNEEALNGWTIVDANNDGSTWAYASSYGASYRYNSTNAANDWLISSCIAIPAGSYKLSFHHVASSSFPESLKVFYGNAPTVEAMTNVIEDYPSLNSNAIANKNFVVAEEGVYYLGFYCYSAADMLRLSIDSIHIEAIPPYEASISNLTFGTPSGCGIESSTISATITNNGSTPLTTFTAAYKVDDNAPVSQEFTLENALALDSSYVFTFETPMALAEVGEYDVVTYITLAGDENHTNDTLAGTIEKMVPEIELTSIVPADEARIPFAESINIAGTITNNSCALTSYIVTYKVGEGEFVANDTIECNVAEGATHNFTHSVPFTPEATGEYTITVKVSKPNDIEDDADDNELTATFTLVGCSAITEFPFEEGFENGMPDCWTTIDADGDGHIWMNTADMISLWEDPEEITYFTHSGNGSLASESYINHRYGALTPENYLITPAITIPTTGNYGLTFYVANTYSYEENLTVKISTTNNDLASFTTTAIEEEEIDVDLNGGEWAEKTYSLANFAGQTIYIAIIHTGEDGVALLVDDFSIAVSNAAEENIAETISVYPNPTSDMVTIANAEGKDIIVVNSLGQVVASIENAAANQTIDVSNFANGTYFVKVDAEVVKLNVVK